mmetsp:Transcript_22269/g.19113  ORF Transcript_22269/g.19113 Transcript_22269/m.19113 type:complete len:117 (+) Transcript_22269:2042-2392(+)
MKNGKSVNDPRDSSSTSSRIATAAKNTRDHQDLKTTARHQREQEIVANQQKPAKKTNIIGLKSKFNGNYPHKKTQNVEVPERGPKNNSPNKAQKMFKDIVNSQNNNYKHQNSSSEL